MPIRSSRILCFLRVKMSKLHEALRADFNNRELILLKSKGGRKRKKVRILLAILRL